MIGAKRARLTATRTVGVALAGLLAVGAAVASGTAFASSGSTVSTMSNMQMTSAGHNHKGFTKGWYDGHTVKFYYSKNFSCASPPASKSASGCEVGTNYTQTPANTFDPLYVIVPLGFTPAKSTLQCPAGHCIDHPSKIDLSAVLGSKAGNVPLPAHSHIVATANGHQSEWWNVDVVGVTSLKTWDKIVRHKSDWELRYLQRHSKNVTGNIPTNLFLYFAVR
ncbi:MAG: hypothetical protein ACLQDY_17940 [Streptosporangiaceae bacterium]